MAYLKRQRIGKQTYLYVMQSVRRRDKVTKKVLEYLGNADDVSAERLRAALRYWKVRQKTRRAGR